MAKETSQDFVLIFGPAAVGKMTVGQELAKLCRFTLFHNHMSRDYAEQFFELGTTGFRNVNEGLRQLVFKEASESDLKGFIFTLVMAIDLQEDMDYIEALSQQFKEKGWAVHFVELYADLEERLKRNKTENRLQHKPSKRDIANSEKVLLYHENKYKMNSDGDILKGEKYLRIDNTSLPASEVAKMIQETFNFSL